MQPLLAASSLRVDVGGAPAVDGLSFEATGDHVLVLGAARALFEAAAGLRAPVRGEVLVGGTRAADAARCGEATGAPLDPPMPPRWTVLEYVTWSARLAGHARGPARALGREALERMQLAAVAETKLRAAAPAVRRGTVVAAALATGVKTLLVDDPLSALPEETSRAFGRVLARALSGRRSVVFAPSMPLASPLALAADEAIVIEGAHVVARGAPAEIAAAERTLALRVLGDVGAFARAVEASGGRAEVTAGAPPPVHVRVELGPLAARDLLRLAADSRAVVLELRPLARAFA